jgi:hypothetical protein
MTDLSERGTRVAQKWGFGMAPVKPHVQADRTTAAKAVLGLLGQPTAADASLEDISTVKGLFNRCHRQDQWDWFTVWQQFGRPGRSFTLESARALADLRRAMSDGDGKAIRAARSAVRLAEGHVHLDTFVNGRSVERPGVGYIYVLSTREQPRMLKIGYTDRSVEERVKEINRSPGIAIPYGVRAVWAVEQARAAEAGIHRHLADYRVRKDREFFDIDFRDAHALIGDYIRDTHRER